MTVKTIRQNGTVAGSVMDLLTRSGMSGRASCCRPARLIIGRRPSRRPGRRPGRRPRGRQRGWLFRSAGWLAQLGLSSSLSICRRRAQAAFSAAAHPARGAAGRRWHPAPARRPPPAARRPPPAVGSRPLLPYKASELSQGRSHAGELAVGLSWRGPAGCELSCELSRELSCELGCELSCEPSCELSRELSRELGCELSRELGCELS